ncbi:pseudouridine synthase [Thalassotalea agariperforans]
MTISHQRLDKFISKHTDYNRKAVKLLVAQKRIKIDGELAQNVDQVVHKFSQIVLDEQSLQNNQPVYLMLHKPVGVVSSTKGGNVNERLRKKDPTQIEEYPTVIDLLTRSDRDQLHYAGRLDLNTSGLMLLTNDSRWSKKLSLPEHQVEKRYQVTLANKLNDDYIAAFAEGMYFSTEDIITKPAKLTIISDYQAEVILTEGKYHQVKRMFGRFQNPVVALHRSAIGQLTLDNNLKAGDYRELTAEEVATIHL